MKNILIHDLIETIRNISNLEEILFLYANENQSERGILYEALWFICLKFSLRKSGIK